MNSESFERSLCEQPLRRVPPEWRNQILEAAKRGRKPEATRETPELVISGWEKVILLLRGRLWPHPVAWAGVAAVWALGIALQLACSGGGPAASSSTPSVQATLQSLLTEQHKELGQLLNTFQSSPDSTESRRHPVPAGTEAVRPGQGAMHTIAHSVAV